jgi:hypothetical protein
MLDNTGQLHFLRIHDDHDDCLMFNAMLGNIILDQTCFCVLGELQQFILPCLNSTMSVNAISEQRKPAKKQIKQIKQNKRIKDALRCSSKKLKHVRRFCRDIIGSFINIHDNPHGLRRFGLARFVVAKQTCRRYPPLVFAPSRGKG